MMNYTFNWVHSFEVEIVAAGSEFEMCASANRAVLCGLRMSVSV